MISQEDKDLIRQELREESREELQREMTLHHDEDFALEEIADDELQDIKLRLENVINQMQDYGWNVTKQDLVDRILEM